ncbi:5-(carboxyamino)imidazole ribonucleotide synthase [Colwellia sp. MB02u-18]|uniref:5-(carboxyamino)imidazole ribonucleotide synthase n=1 Tax=unclassified Colwellia TaxID=196834 RepID=UPI0015F4C625|nr:MULTISPECIES: 5-(carboxyamino)imidazole ribonucleotide synthase [unclassified Colwellia]MBA6225520.1 5-(carboxyamino)imidazole ribonucleotide synthase [Colwellia sp. MB3u-45]MBA6268297.1 5-(carboxyamino)imidazole ribonucleotide synthase [Colwellia sp. MB3u-43]MBA6321680.1 5-(carboxyamino)imidazole ribonucleotide synthase [Colwellia sp. MB02u-19]MBA6324077.1 5-(carboxyamino)imidazole ribonucleotide synthase [Colwellia sp. MB02u-18]MBA6330898.1 5-(carboxyamino)imidazole ribonucleotide synthas
MNVLVLGAGQLARMMALAVKPLNINIRAFDVGSDTVVDPLSTDIVFGGLTQGIEFADFITAEFEHIDHQTLALCQASGKLRPSSQAIKIGGDRRLEKDLLIKCGVANAQHQIIATKADFDQALNNLSMPLILKSALAGYDGKGQWRLKDKAQAEDIWLDIKAFFDGGVQGLQHAVVAEQMVPFDREVSLVGARDSQGNTVVYPLTQNHHTNGVLSVSIAIEIDEALQAQAKQVFDSIAKELNYIGILAIEFFQIGEQLLVNEIAPRVHNSGHWTQQGADTCQFENHLRAVCDLPLGSTELIRPSAMINILGEDEVPNEILSVASTTLHWYGKSKRPGRKMGHINVSGNDEKQLAERLTLLADMLPEAAFDELKPYVASYQKKLS